MRTKLWFPLFVCALMAGSLPAQQAQAPQPNPAPDAHLVRVRTGSSTGMCYGYCAQETIIVPGSMRSISRAFSQKWKYPDVKSKSKLAKKDWNDLQLLLDAKTLAAFTGPIGCPGCVDEVVEWVEVDFSDGTKKAVSFNSGDAPPQIAALMQKIKAVGTKPKP